MPTQQIKLDINKIRPEVLKMFYAHILNECIKAKANVDLYNEYLEQKG